MLVGLRPNLKEGMPADYHDKPIVYTPTIYLLYPHKMQFDNCWKDSRGECVNCITKNKISYKGHLRVVRYLYLSVRRKSDFYSYQIDYRATYTSQR